MQRAAAGPGSDAVGVILSRAATKDFEEVLSFWFGSAPDDPATPGRQAKLWWDKNPEVDAQIRARFGALRLRAIAGELAGWERTARGRLALIILVDQFSRNLFRGDPEAFRHDPLARRWTNEGLAAGADARLRAIERLFFYLPLEHSEDLADQERAVSLIGALGFENFRTYAERHRDIVARFGRFPHRNAILGRVSTPEEVGFLQQPGSGF